MLPLNLKTIKSITNSDPINVYPKECVFSDIEINQTYEMIVYVQNLSKVPQRIKVMQPTTSKFRVDYDTTGSIAAGLTVKLVIVFETNNLDDFNDKFHLIYEKSGKKQDVEITLSALKPQAQISFENFIDLGFARINREKQHVIRFRNQGKQVGKIKVVFEHLQGIKLNPSQFQIQPNDICDVSLIYV